MDQVKLRLQCQNIFSAARHLQFGNLRARSDWAMEILLCSLIPYPRQRKQRKPNNANNVQNIMGDTTDTSTRQRNDHAKDISLHALGIWSTHWVRITPDEMV